MYLGILYILLTLFVFSSLINIVKQVAMKFCCVSIILQNVLLYITLYSTNKIVFLSFIFIICTFQFKKSLYENEYIVCSVVFSVAAFWKKKKNILSWGIVPAARYRVPTPFWNCRNFIPCSWACHFQQASIYSSRIQNFNTNLTVLFRIVLG